MLWQFFAKNAGVIKKPVLQQFVFEDLLIKHMHMGSSVSRRTEQKPTVFRPLTYSWMIQYTNIYISVDNFRKG